VGNFPAYRGRGTASQGTVVREQGQPCCWNVASRLIGSAQRRAAAGTSAASSSKEWASGAATQTQRALQPAMGAALTSRRRVGAEVAVWQDLRLHRPFSCGQSAPATVAEDLGAVRNVDVDGRIVVDQACSANAGVEQDRGTMPMVDAAPTRQFAAIRAPGVTWQPSPSTTSWQTWAP